MVLIMPEIKSMSPMLHLDDLWVGDGLSEDVDLDLMLLTLPHDVAVGFPC